MTLHRWRKSPPQIADAVVGVTNRIHLIRRPTPVVLPSCSLKIQGCGDDMAHRERKARARRHGCRHRGQGNGLELHGGRWRRRQLRIAASAPDRPIAGAVCRSESALMFGFQRWRPSKSTFRRSDFCDATRSPNDGDDARFEAEPNLGFGVYGRYGFVGAGDVGI